MKPHYKRNRHSCYSLKYHLVVVTKYRHKVINKAILNSLIEISKNIFEEKWGCEIIEINGEQDHLHLLFEAPPQVQLSSLINNYKTVSSRLIRKAYKEEIEKYYWKPYFWSRSYLLLSSGGAQIEVIKQYIKEQDSPKE
ncbi:IS200/IS605 family transposase [Clostridium disporicum]|uniref:IS200/IS605 family transposase n=1 Tax=Clostridium disporicum TaxID=84024 RepID=UPI0034A4AE8F